MPSGSCEPPAEPGGTWRPIPDSGLGIRGIGFTHAWTGEELLIWGEATEEDGQGRPIHAAAYAPETGQWRDVSADGVLEGGPHAGSVWTGSEWIVWGGLSQEPPEEDKAYRVIGDGARYDPQTDEWTAIAPSPLGGRFGAAALWTGTEMLIWGGFDEDGALTAEDHYGAAYDPASDSWRLLSQVGSPRVNLAPVWADGYAVVWVGLRSQIHAAKYNAALDTWSPVTTNGAPIPSGGALWTGEEVLAWAFVAQTWARYNGSAYNPQTDSWRSLSTEGAPPSSREVWTGSRVLTWGDYNGCALVGSYDVAGDRWTRLGGDDAPEARGEPALVWTGSSLLVFGGRRGQREWTDGGEFVPGEP